MLRRNSLLAAVLVCFVFCGVASAQDWGGPRGFGGPGPVMGGFHDHQFGEWWNLPRLSQQLGITAEQKQKMDNIYEQHKLKLIDLNANLQRQQVLLQPMISADNPDKAKTLAQIDAVVEAHAALEKENADMLFAIREALTPAQWQKLKALHQERREHRMDRRGRGMWKQGPDGGPGAGPGAGPGGTPPPPPDSQPNSPQASAPPQS